jgi:molybdenum cofactor cytidylyltransferase
MTVALLLAAGSSTRMGQPKMLLPFNGKTLLQHCIDEIKKSSAGDLVVVTGCYHSLLKEILNQQQIAFTENAHWQQGMGSSIQKGINFLLERYPKANSVIILVCDQPHISSSLINKIMNKQTETGKKIVASFYDDTTGTPVLFYKKYFKLLSELDGIYGAKKIVQQFKEDTVTIDFPKGSIDIDTPEDYSLLVS